ncbi:MAG: FtsW/RodA/SpoVE family cell cycle protein, partial [Candidatus Vogelbacteria bacterium]|nr:FtsW/RodA/SpoVE family cell cycle protein [Candidatus Vogelbacteria bacterium]
MFKQLVKNTDWVLFFAAVPLLAAGLLTMSSFSSQNYFFARQLIWVVVSVVAFFGASLVDWRFLRKSEVATAIYAVGLVLLSVLFLVGQIKGAKSWLSFGSVAFEPANFMEIALIILLAKYFSRRHIEIANFRHILLTGVYTLIPFSLVLLQPNFGSALIIFALWLGMILVSGVSKKHLFILICVLVVAFGGFWSFVAKPYQQARILSFVNPLADIRGAGYNAFQSQVAVGSGQLVGKGVGYGTQSRLSFLPEYETDFMFAAFAEEWGFVGVLIVFILFGIILWRILHYARVGATNFETLFALGVAILFTSYLAVHIGMNIGLLPVTGLPLPFMSYGGSHLLTEFILLGMLMGMKRYSLAYHRDDVRNEFLG